MKKLLSRFGPKRIDRFFIAVVLMFFAALVVPEFALTVLASSPGENDSLLSIVPLALMSLILVCSLGIQPIRAVGQRWWLLICWLAVLGFLSWRIHVLHLPTAFFHVIAGLVAACFIAFWLSKLTSFFAEKVFSREAFKFSRTKVLIAFAGFCYLMAIISRLLLENDMQGWQVSGGSMSVLPLASILFFFASVFVPCLLLQRLEKYRELWWTAAYWVAIGIPIAIVVGLINLEYLVWFALGLPITFFVILIRPASKYFETNPDRRPFVQPTLWSWMAYLAAVVAMFFTFQYAPANLLSKNQAADTIKAKLVYAQLARKYQMLTGGKTKLAGNSSAFEKVAIDFEADPASDYLQPISILPTTMFLNLHLTNFQTNLDAGSLVNHSKNVDIQGGQATTDQIADLSQNADYMYLRGVKLYPGSAEPQRRNGVGKIQWVVRELPPGSISLLLESVPAGAKTQSFFVTTTELNRSDWEQIARVSSLGIWSSIHFLDSPSDAFFEAIEAHPKAFARISVEFAESVNGANELRRKLFWDGRVRINIQSIANLLETTQDFWDFHFSRLENQYVSIFKGIVPFDMEGSEDFSEFAIRSHLAYGMTPSGEIEKIWLPTQSIYVLDHLGELSSLTSLVIRKEWLINEPRDPLTKNNSVGIAACLEKIPSLTELRLDLLTPFTEFAFAKKLTRLERLEFNADTLLLPPCDFQASYFPSLKHLTIVGPCTKSVMSEIQKIKTLKTLTYLETAPVNSNRQKNAIKLKALETLLPNVQIEMGNQSEEMSKPSKEFLEHRQLVRKQLLEQYLAKQDKND